MLQSQSPAESQFEGALQAYLRTTLHAPISLEDWKGAARLPIFLSQRYRFYQTVIARSACLLMAALDSREATPDEIAKNVATVSKAFDGVVVLATEYMSATMRARLIAQGTAFVVPGNQLYIPQIALDLREHYRAAPLKAREKLSPIAQVVLFHHVLEPNGSFGTAAELARALPYTRMSIGRAFDELALRQLATIERKGREKVISYPRDRRMLIDMSKTLLRRPARGVHAVTFHDSWPPMFAAGETALAELTDLAPPRLPVFAIAAMNWQGFFKEHEIADHHYDFEGEAIVETWHYDPAILGKRGVVDPLSLYAQFWDSADERVARAVNELLERIDW